MMLKTMRIDGTLAFLAFYFVTFFLPLGVFALLAGNNVVGSLALVAGVVMLAALWTKVIKPARHQR